MGFIGVDHRSMNEGLFANHGQLPSRYTTEENVPSSYINRVGVGPHELLPFP